MALQVLVEVLKDVDQFLWEVRGSGDLTKWGTVWAVESYLSQHTPHAVSCSVAQYPRNTHSASRERTSVDKLTGCHTKATAADHFLPHSQRTDTGTTCGNID